MRFLGVFLVMCAAACSESYRGAWVDAGLEHAGQEVKAPARFREAVLSWAASVPAGGEVECELQVKVGDRWLPWQTMGRWNGREGGRSVKREGAEGCSVDVDTLVLDKGLEAEAFRYRVTPRGGSRVRLVAVATWRRDDRAPLASERSAAWGKTIDVPKRSQMVEDASIRGDICSATSLSMVLEHYGVKRTTREVADGVYDHEAKIYGNWPLNTAYAAAAGMKAAYVARFRGLEDLEAEIAAGRPVILSHKWKEGELTGAPVTGSSGHLIVVVGFTDEGDVVVNDPAAHPDQGEDVRRVYPREELYHTWLENAAGVAYVIRKE
mgnify:CR=1 FL=1